MVSALALGVFTQNLGGQGRWKGAPELGSPHTLSSFSFRPARMASDAWMVHGSISKLLFWLSTSFVTGLRW